MLIARHMNAVLKNIRVKESFLKKTKQKKTGGQNVEDDKLFTVTQNMHPGTCSVFTLLYKYNIITNDKYFFSYFLMQTYPVGNH